MENNNTYEIYSIPKYRMFNHKNMKKSLEEIKSALHCDSQFHEQLYSNDLLKIFVDIDQLSIKSQNRKI